MQSLKKLCADAGYGLEFTEIDILVGGKDHDLFDKARQDEFLQQVEAGAYHINILSPPCGTWSRANWANKAGPQPCRDRQHPWGMPPEKFDPKVRARQLARADDGNEFVHFSVRVIRASAAARANGHFTRAYSNTQKTWAAYQPANLRAFGSSTTCAKLTASPYSGLLLATNASFRTATGKSRPASSLTSTGCRLSAI